MRPDFGCDIHSLVFAPNSTTTAGRAAFFAEQALKRWEPRIEVQRVEARPDREAGDRLLVEIEYQVIATNTIFNLVYPFYLTEGIGG
jgi:phage baseplate assembly protein W